MSLKELCINTILNHIGISKDLFNLRFKIPEKLFREVIIYKQNNGSRFWLNILKNLPDETEDPQEIFNINDSDISWGNFDFDFNSVNINEFLYILTVEDWANVYNHKKLCILNKRRLLNDQYVCYPCWTKFTAVLLEPLYTHKKTIHVTFLSDFVQDRRHWCSICMKAPLFRVLRYRDCCKEAVFV